MTCNDCAFNFDGICAGCYHYGEFTKNLSLCADWKMSLNFFDSLCKKGYSPYSIDLYDSNKKYD